MIVQTKIIRDTNRRVIHQPSHTFLQNLIDQEKGLCLSCGEESTESYEDDGYVNYMCPHCNRKDVANPKDLMKKHFYF